MKTLQEIALIGNVIDEKHVSVEDNKYVYPGAKFICGIEDVIVSPLMVAGYMVAIYSLFEKLLPDESQLKFEEITYDAFKKAFKQRHRYCDELKNFDL
jgi:hypothetical protein